MTDRYVKPKLASRRPGRRWWRRRMMRRRANERPERWGGGGVWVIPLGIVLGAVAGFVFAPTERGETTRRKMTKGSAT
jgi:hypothetical protein